MIATQEILHRITEKVTASVLKKEVISSAESLQVSVGQEAGLKDRKNIQR